jgi:hypothetical protein
LTVRVFDDRVLRGIFKFKEEEITGMYRKLRNEELHNLTLYRILLA